MKVWVLMWYGEHSAHCCGVVSDQRTADEWAVQGEGNESVGLELDELPRGFRRGILQLG